MRISFKHAALAAACFSAFPAYATNGYFLPGFGIRSEGMGGVGIAYGADSLSTAANPANAVSVGKRADIGFAIFNPERHATVGEPAGGGTAFGFSGDVESDAKYFIMPEAGFNIPLSDRLYVALALVGNGGMNTTYSENFFSFYGTPPQDSKLGVDMMQVLVPITLAYKVNETHALGASLVLAETRFRAYGLEAFRYFDQVLNFPISSDPDHLTDKGYDYSYGAGVRVGWKGNFIGNRLSLGLTYASKAYMTEFDEYRGLFAEQGDFDIPENYGVGIAFRPAKGLVIAADVTRINYSDVASVGNRGMENVPGTAGVPSLAAGANPNPYELGNDLGMGFGWEDQTVYKLGVQYGVNNRLQLRAGFNYGESPIPDDQLTFNLLAPATVEKHYSVGFTYRANDQLEVTGTYMYAASHSQSGCRNNILNCVEFNMHQNVFGLTFGWLIDPGVDQMDAYGDGEWGGIDFDGLYAGFSFGQSRYRDIAADWANTRTEGWKATLGYAFNKYLSVEGAYVNLNDMTEVAGDVRRNIATDAWALGAIGSFPLSDRFAVMGKIGVAYMLADIKIDRASDLPTDRPERAGDDGWEPNYGVGLSYAVLNNVDVRAEWERFDRKDLDIDLMTAGLALKF